LFLDWRKNVFLESYVRVCHYRIRNNVFENIFFRVEGPMVFHHHFDCLYRGTETRTKLIRFVAFRRLFGVKSESCPFPQRKFHTFHSDC
jgi:hypothetical protein